MLEKSIEVIRPEHLARTDKNLESGNKESIVFPLIIGICDVNITANIMNIMKCLGG